jgi:hypothetical protein
MDLYRIVIFLHVAGAFAFVFAHGVSATVAFKLRSEKAAERVRALLDLSGYSYGLMYGSLLLLLLAGIVAGFMGNFWGKGWIWTSLVVLILTAAFMYARGSTHYSAIRKAAGLPYFANGKAQPAVTPQSDTDIASLLTQGRAVELAGVGGLALLVLLWLMLFKPF